MLYSINDLFTPRMALSTSWMFKTLIHSLIFKKNLSHEDLQKRYANKNKKRHSHSIFRSAAATNYFEHLDLADLKQVIDDATINDAAVNMPLDIKLLIVGDAVQFVTQRDKSEPSTTNKSKGGNKKKQADLGTMSYNSLVTHFERVHDHLLTVQSATSLLNSEFVSLLHNVDVNYYITSLWKAFNNYAKVNDRCTRFCSNNLG